MPSTLDDLFFPCSQFCEIHISLLSLQQTAKHSPKSISQGGRIWQVCYISRFIKGGVQWKQGVVFCMMLHTILLYCTTPIHCTPLRLHPPLMNTQYSRLVFCCRYMGRTPPETAIIFENRYMFMVTFICK